MTLVGKIFTVLILIMSVAFMMLAVTVFSTHRNWRDVVIRPQSEATAEKPVGLKFEIERLSEVNRDLREEINRAGERLAIEQAARRFALAALQSRLEQSEMALQQARGDFQDLQAAHGVMVEELANNEMTLTKLTDEVNGLRDEIRLAQQARNEKFNTVVTLTDQLNAIEGQRQLLSERQTELVAQVARMKKVMDKFELTENTPTDDIPPRVDGVVTAVSDRNLVEISIGADDGLREGHTLEVYRNNSYLGRVVVISTQPDRSVATILRDYRRGIIKKGDRVATKLS